MNSYEDKLCDAIEAIVNDRVDRANYDRTVQGTIVRCEDETVGKYKIKYQDGYFYAYAADINVKYTKGKVVYILVPGNNFKNQKTILGAAEKLGSDYAVSIEDKDAYEIIGSDCIETIEGNEPFTLCTYETKEYQVYDRNKDEQFQRVKIDEQGLLQYIEQSTSVKIGATFQTNIDLQQRTGGNYGIQFDLVFKDNAIEEDVIRSYVLDIPQMLGEPYLFSEPSNQSVFFNIDSENFKEIDKITLFCENFPYQEENKPSDIFITDISLECANLLDESAMGGIAITFITKQGMYFSAGDGPEAKRSIEAEVRVKGKVVKSDTAIQYYWFRENPSIDSSNQKFNVYGGPGWECLNNFNILTSSEGNENDEKINWVPGDKIFNVIKKNCLTKENRFKCVVNYNGALYGKIITIRNLGYTYDLSINSNEGTKFYFDNGSPNLTCIIKDENGNEVDYKANYSYFWSVTDSNNNYTIWTDNIKTDEIGRSYIDKFPIKIIDNFATIKCAVYLENMFLGSAAITLTNSLETEGTYSLVINNGEQIFQYDEYGTSPAAAASLTPITVLPLTFTVFDNLGNPIEDSVISKGTIEWQVPNKNTMLKVQNVIEDDFIESKDEYTSYVQCLTLPIDINDAYNLYYQDNTITLNVKYKDINLVAKTNFTFTKEGEIGTNGTNYICRIVPNTKQSFSEWPMLIDDGKTLTWNFQKELLGSDRRYFKVQLFDGTERLFEGTTSQNPFTLKWELLQNTYSGSIKDNAYMIVSKDGVITLNNNTFSYDEKSPSSFASVIKCTVTYNGKNYYATMPFITFKKTSDKLLKLKHNSGYHYVEYSSDGTQPKYIDAKKTYPFELQVIDNNGNDISSNYNSANEWKPLGTIKEKNGTNWIEVLTKNLTINKDKETNAIPKGLIAHATPIDKYMNEGVTDIVMCTVPNVGSLYIPIHFYLNRYGMAAINDWDGNSIEIDNDGGHILAPQIGAGKKETDNSFTGLVMGVAKVNSTTNTGLFGFSKGVRTIFLDAETGKAEFGANNKGKIIIDPSNNQAIIKSGNYSTTDKTGMQIDLTTPEIRFGSGNFIVNKSGHLTAKGGGSIGGWTIGDTTLTGVNQNNKTTITLDSGNVKIYSGSKSTFTNSYQEGFYLGPDGIALGSNNPFQVTAQGKITAKDGIIGGATITGNSIYMESGNDGWGLYAHRGHASNIHGGIAMNIGGNQANIGGSRFIVYHDGTLQAKDGIFSGTINATAGNIGNWSIENGVIVGGNIRLTANGSLSGPNWSINNDGSAHFSNVLIDNATGGTNIQFGNCTWTPTGGIRINGLGSVSLGGSLLSGLGTSISKGAYAGGIGGQLLSSWIEELAVNKLIANNIITGGLDSFVLSATALEAAVANIEILRVRNVRIVGPEYPDNDTQNVATWNYVNETEKGIKAWVTANFQAK